MSNLKGLESVKEYYGRFLKSNKDLQTSACCTSESLPFYLRPILAEIAAEVKDKFYGCGSPIPHALEGMTVLDLGSGSGRDCYILSKLVGPKGKVIGIDMTPEQIEVAERHLASHTQKFGYSTPNIQFIKGYIEDLEDAGISSNSIDVVISNCVINLSPHKDRVFSEIFRVLKPGGELHFSDVFSSRRIPKSLTEDAVVVGECLGGALYTEDFRRLLFKLGCADYRVTARAPLTLNNPAIAQKTGLIEFSSVTVRAFKLQLEDRCEDYGQFATYLGTLPDSPHAFRLDDHHLFEKGRPLAVCQNTAKMVSETRYGSHFKVTGQATTHFGLFDCGPSGGTPGPVKTSLAPGACC